MTTELYATKTGKKLVGKVQTMEGIAYFDGLDNEGEPDWNGVTDTLSMEDKAPDEWIDEDGGSYYGPVEERIRVYVLDGISVSRTRQSPDAWESLVFVRNWG